MDLIERQPPSRNETPSPRNFSKPGPITPVKREVMSAEGAAAAPSRVPAPDTPVAAETKRSWKPLGFLTAMRNVPVKMPPSLFILRVGQLLAAGVVIGCVVWNLTYNDFSGYHDTTIVLLFAAAWTMFPTTILTWPLKGLKHVLDPRLTLFADGLACVLWGMTFTSYNSVLWNIETRTKFWATAEGPTPSSSAASIATVTMESLPAISSVVVEMLPSGLLSPVAIPTSVTSGRFNVDERALMPHHAISLDARGTILGPNGLVPNHEANVTWWLGQIASYFAAGEFILYALTTIVFAYYFHSALVADTATHLPRGPRASVATPGHPTTTVYREKAKPADLEANPHSEEPTSKDNAGIVGKIAGSLGTLKSPLRKGSEPTNDSAVFGIANKHGIEVKESKGDAAKVEGGKSVFPTHGIVPGWDR